jgi:hypothetical protein
MLHPFRSASISRKSPIPFGLSEVEALLSSEKVRPFDRLRANGGEVIVTDPPMFASVVSTITDGPQLGLN